MYLRKAHLKNVVIFDEIDDLKLFLNIEVNLTNILISFLGVCATVFNNF